MIKNELNENWKLVKKSEGTEKGIELNVKIPSSVFDELINNDLIEDPFYGENENDVEWVYNTDWQYEIDFDAPENIFKKKNVFLKFHGIDTYSEINLNGKILGNTDNMHKYYEFNVKDVIKNKGNRLTVLITSAVRKASDDMKIYGHANRFDDFNIWGVQFVRKPQFSFGWDWGPKLPDIGIWQPVELIGYDDIKIESLYIVQEFDYNKDPLQISESREIKNLKINKINLQVQIEFKFDALPKNNIVEITLLSPDGEIMSNDELIKDKIVCLELMVRKPKLWWIYELGNPHLYDLKVIIRNGETIIDTQTQKIGLRDIRLIRNPDKWGETFYFLLNGVPIFAKGANWIPIDSFIPRGKKLGLYELNLNYAKEANMNMLRVWGGGIYEDERFYDLCDELGILVWQDFPFACGIYRPDPDFVENVKEEAIQNIKRLRNRACLVLWCGNNENEWFQLLYLVVNFKWKIGKMLKYKRGYKEMFEHILPEITNDLDPNRAYWPSSPSNGGRFGKGGRGLLKSNSPKRGDSHYWAVWHLGKPFSAYRKFNSRFMSEYGFEAFPPIKTIKSFCPHEQFDMFSPIMENHQKNRAGNKKLLKYMKRRFIIPEQFEKQVVLSQITQGEAIEYGVEHWRINRNDYHCMGSLYWQLNDCWPVASWSSLDYFMRWKALHYFAKRFYRPFFACVYETNDNVDLYCVNDLQLPQKGIVKWELVNNNGTKLVEGEKSVEVDPCSSVVIESIDLHTIIKSNKELRKIVIFYYLFSEEDELLHKGFRLFDDPKHFPLRNPNLEWGLVELDGKKEIELNVKAEDIALFVHIDSEKYDFVASDNYFSLNNGESYRIVLTMKRKVSIKELKSSLTVNSLYNLLN